MGDFWGCILLLSVNVQTIHADDLFFTFGIGFQFFTDLYLSINKPRENNFRAEVQHTHCFKKQGN